jgi:hypothetical protein
MNDLRAANVDKCLTLLNEFCDSIPVDDNPDLLSRKQEAGKALEHLGILFNAQSDQPEEEDGGCGSCASQVQLNNGNGTSSCG